MICIPMAHKLLFYGVSPLYYLTGSRTFLDKRRGRLDHRYNGLSLIIISKAFVVSIKFI